MVPESGTSLGEASGQGIWSLEPGSARRQTGGADAERGCNIDG
jgi:hypothetical protein